MEPYPKHCLICGREIGAGIDAHIRQRHRMDYDSYCKWFYDAQGSYSICKDSSGQTVLTITRILRPE